MGFQPEVLPPGGSMEVPITFYPREAMRYHERVVFEINDCAKQMVEILGQGIEMKVRSACVGACVCVCLCLCVSLCIPPL